MSRSGGDRGVSSGARANGGDSGARSSGGRIQHSEPARRRTRRKRTRGPARRVDGERQRRRYIGRNRRCVTAPATCLLTPVRVTDTRRSARRFRVVLCLPRPEVEAASTSPATAAMAMATTIRGATGTGPDTATAAVLRRLLRSVVRGVSHVSAIHLHVERRGIAQAEDQAARGRGLRRRLLRRHRRRLRRDLPEAAHRFRCPSDRGPRAWATRASSSMCASPRNIRPRTRASSRRFSKD